MESSMRKAFRTKNVIGMAVKTPDHKQISVIEEVVLDIEAGTIAYAGFAEKFFAIPWDEFKLVLDEAANYFIVDTSASRLRKLPSFNKKDWPETTTREWDGHVDKHYQRSEPIEDEEAWINASYGG